MSYLALQSGDDHSQRHGLRRYWKGHYLPALPEAAVVALLADRDDRSPDVSLQTYGGAIAGVGDEESAFGHRGAAFEYTASSSWTDPDADEERMAGARAAAARLAPFASGAYVNALGDEGSAGVGRAYPAATLARLTEVKDAHDPDNIFHLNHNIVPTGEGAAAVS